VAANDIAEQAFGPRVERTGCGNLRAIVARRAAIQGETGGGRGLSGLMRIAGFTQGGFYPHLRSKATWWAEVLLRQCRGDCDSPNWQGAPRR